MAKDIYVQLTKEWGGFKVGDVVRFGYNKGISRIDAGFGVQVKKQPAVNDPPPAPEAVKEKPKVETATAPGPAMAETADAPPKAKEKKKAKKETE